MMTVVPTKAKSIENKGPVEDKRFIDSLIHGRKTSDKTSGNVGGQWLLIWFWLLSIKKDMQCGSSLQKIDRCSGLIDEYPKLNLDCNGINNVIIVFVHIWYFVFCEIAVISWINDMRVYYW